MTMTLSRQSSLCLSAVCRNYTLANPRLHLARCSLSSPALALAVAPLSLINRPSSRSYYTPATPQPSPYSPVETQILSAAISHVPALGFTTDALASGARDAGYLPATVNLFTRGAFELVMYHLVSQRRALQHAVQFPQPPDGSSLPDFSARVRTLMAARLHANTPIHPRLVEVLGLMSLAGNMPASLAELGRLADEICYLAGDTAVDSSWYTKRGLLATVYSTAELFMTQDKSPEFRDTEQFLDRRLNDVLALGRVAGDVGEWVEFNSFAAINVLRSVGVKI